MTVQTFEDLQSTMEGTFQGFLDDVYDELDRIVDMLNGASDLLSTAVSVINPFDGINPFSSTVKRAIDKWNDEILPETERRLAELVDNVWDAIGDLAGRPLDLLDYSRAFNEVKAQIYTENDMAQQLVLVSGFWSGRAWENYETVARAQDEAVRDFSLAMDAGGTLTSGVANQILSLWSELVEEFLSWGSDLLRIFASATEVDSILTFETPAILTGAATIWQNIIDLGTTLTNYLIEQATTGANSWQQLANGARGLPQNQWPMVREGNSDMINDAGEWTPQSA